MKELTKSNDRTSQTMRAIHKDLRTEGALGIRPYTTPQIEREGGRIEAGAYLDETIGRGDPCFVGFRGDGAVTSRWGIWD
jgi:hypothetical protein